MKADRQEVKTLVRLTNRADFLKIQSQGRKWISQGLILQVMPNTLGQSRVGFTVSKKASGSAVRRNRIKRRLRAAAAEILPGRAAPSHDYVLVGRALTATRPYADLLGDLEWSLRRLGLENGTASDA